MNAQIRTSRSILYHYRLILLLSAVLAAPVLGQSFDQNAYPGGQAGRWGTTLDLDGTSGLDILVANEGNGSLSRLVSNGNGTFTSSSLAVGSSGSASVAAADLDGDGDEDAVVVSHFGGEVWILTNTGGSLSLTQTLTPGGSPFDVALADLDGVNGPDIVIANAASGVVSVWRNEGGGVFEGSWTRQDYGAQVGVQAVSTGDFDGDGLIDVAAASPATDSVLVLANQGSGVLGAPTIYPVDEQPVDLVAVDLDADGDIDLATANWMSDSISVLLQQGGWLLPAVHYSTGIPSQTDLMGSTSLTAGDLDCDGHPDIAVANLLDESLSLFLNDGTAGFTALPGYLPVTAPSFVEIAELNGQAGLDLLVTNFGSPGTLTVLLNASEACPTQCVPAPPGMVAWWDYVGGGANDLIGEHFGWPIGSGPFFTLDAKVGDAALSFNGSDGFFAVPDSGSLDIGTEDLTLDLWVRPGSSTGVRALVEKADGNGQGYGLYLLGGNEVAFRLDDGTGSSLWTATGSLAVGIYTHVTVTLDRSASDGGRFYLGGQLAGVFDPTLRDGDVSNTADLLLGHGLALGNSYFQGDLDEIELFGRSLAAFEVARLAYADSHGKCKPCPAVAPPGQQVAWWPLDEATGPDAHDIAGGNKGTHQGPIPQSNGRVGGALKFNTFDDKVVVPHHSSLNFGNGDFSWDFWVYRASDDPAAIFSKWMPYFGYRFVINAGGGLTLDLWGGTDCHYAFFWHSSGTVPLEKWTHIAVTVDRSSSQGVKFYIDGQPAGSGNAASFWGNVDNTAPLWIGSLHGNWQIPDAEYSLDEIEFHKKVLSPAEVIGIYESGHHGKCKEVCHVPSETTIHPWQSSKAVHISVYNGAPVPKTFSVQLAPVPVGAWPGLTIDGPTEFDFPDPLHPQLLTVPPGGTDYATVVITRPAGMFAGDEAGFVVAVTDVETNHGTSCAGTLRATNGTFEAGPQLTASFGFVPAGEELQMDFDLINQGSPISSVDWQIEAGPSDGDASDAALSLNGLPPGVPLRGHAEVPAGISVSVGVGLRMLHGDAFNLHDIVLTLDLDGDGVFEERVGRAAVQAAPPRLLPVANLVTRRVPSGVELTWSWQSPATSIEIWRNGVLIATRPASETQFVDTVGTGAFTYRLIAVDDSLGLRSEPSRTSDLCLGPPGKR
ncbi:MAG: LamG-like jellyroll fold domain-containing protein [Planctomycetota bacterium]